MKKESYKYPDRRTYTKYKNEKKNHAAHTTIKKPDNTGAASVK